MPPPSKTEWFGRQKKPHAPHPASQIRIPQDPHSTRLTREAPTASTHLAVVQGAHDHNEQFLPGGRRCGRGRLDGDSMNAGSAGRSRSSSGGSMGNVCSSARAPTGAEGLCGAFGTAGKSGTKRCRRSTAGGARTDFNRTTLIRRAAAQFLCRESRESRSGAQRVLMKAHEGMERRGYAMAMAALTDAIR
jgi:hypothetical protein